MKQANDAASGRKGDLRREAILQALKRQGRITVAEIVDRFQCSEATARRDLDLLERTEPVIRTIGGALYDGTLTAREVTFAEKTHLRWIEKEQIAQTAAALVEEGDVIGLSGGTTTYLIAKSLKARSGITVVTNAVNIAVELADSEGIQVVVTGGILRGKSYELCGPLAEKMVRELNIGKMFLGVDGITVEQGATTYSEAEAEIAKALIRRSQRTYAVFDHSKMNRASLFSIAPLSALHGIVTDAPPDSPLVRTAIECGIRVHSARRTENASP
jgi:DeoR family transcriptional regulator of aga operon